MEWHEAWPLRSRVLHTVWTACKIDSSLPWIAVMFRVQKQAALSLRFLFLNRIGKRPGRNILPDAGHLPRDLYIGLIGVDGITVIFNLAGDSCVRILPITVNW